LFRKGRKTQLKLLLTVKYMLKILQHFHSRKGEREKKHYTAKALFFFSTRSRRMRRLFHILKFKIIN